MGFKDVSAPGRAIEAGSGRSRGCERRARRRQFGTRLTRTARIGRAGELKKTPGEDVRDWSRGEDARAFSPGGSEIRRLRDLTSKSRAWVRACASASGTARPRHGKFLAVVGLNGAEKRFFHSGSPLAAAAVLGFLTRALRIRHPNSWQIFWKKPKTKKAYNGREKKSAEISAISCHERKRRAGERRSVFVRSWLSSTDRESRASRVHDPPLAQRTRFPRSARRSDPIRRAIRWRTRRTRLSAPSARGRRATPHRG